MAKYPLNSTLQGKTPPMGLENPELLQYLARFTVADCSEPEAFERNIHSFGPTLSITQLWVPSPPGTEV